jgi:hypothetical protein
MRGKNVTKGMFDIHYSLEEEEEEDCRAEQSRAEVRSCREGSADHLLQRKEKVCASSCT